MFAFIIGYFYIMYNKITKASKYESNEIIKDETEKKRNKRFYIILAIEGIAIFVIQTVLLNIHHQEIFFPLFALIVGLHFFPLGKLYDSWFYYFTGIWICIVAIIALIIALKTNELSYIPAAIVGIGCAVATSVNGLRIIRESRISLNK